MPSLVSCMFGQSISRISRRGDEALLTDSDGRRWRVLDLWSDDHLPRRVLGDAERQYSGARLFLSADGDGRRERYVYYHRDAPGRGASRSLADAATVAAQLELSRSQGLSWPRPVGSAGYLSSSARR